MTSMESDSEIDADEVENMISWKPKRGSIKLPELPEGTNLLELVESAAAAVQTT